MDSLPQLPDSFALGFLVGLVLPWVSRVGLKLVMYGVALVVLVELLLLAGVL